MPKLDNLKPSQVFRYFEEISAIPRGSENMTGIAQYCENFAKEHKFSYVRDKANNVVIMKPATQGYENSEPVILQGHLDIVCQKDADKIFDFEKDGIELVTDGDFITANGTTLGADNGIAVALILAILDSENIPHPPIEAVFTTDEEIGMIGAIELDMSILKGKRMINLDAEEDDSVTVSCAGGSDFKVKIPLTPTQKDGTKITLDLKGLKGGHSGVEIHKGRVNANKLTGELLTLISESSDFDIISINGGDKSNAIPNRSIIEFLVSEKDAFTKLVIDCLESIKARYTNEPDFTYSIECGEIGSYGVFNEELKQHILHILLNVPDGVIEMSHDIEGLVETSTNLGILKTDENEIMLHFALRSNKNSGLIELEKQLCAFFEKMGIVPDTFGHYPPWEYNENSVLRELYKSVYADYYGKDPKVEAIHAGLECGVFASQITDFDCIAIGPDLRDVHTVNEKLSISSTENLYNLLLKILEKLK